MRVTIFSTGGKFHPVSIFTQLHTLTLVAHSYALLLGHVGLKGHTRTIPAPLVAEIDLHKQCHSRHQEEKQRVVIQVEGNAHSLREGNWE